MPKDITQDKITETRAYREAAFKIAADLEKYYRVRRIPVKVIAPKDLVEAVEKYIDKTLAFDQLRESMEYALSRICTVSDWYYGEDDRGKTVIRFIATPKDSS